MKGKLYSKLDRGLLVTGIAVGWLSSLVGVIRDAAGGYEHSEWWLPLAMFSGLILSNLPRCIVLLIVGGPRRWIETMVREPVLNGFSIGIGLTALYIAVRTTGHVGVLGNSIYFIWIITAALYGAIPGIILWGALLLIRHRFMSYRRDNGVFIQVSADGSIRVGNPLWGTGVAWCAIPDITVQPGKDPQFTVTILVKSECRGYDTVITPITLTVFLPNWKAAGETFDFERLCQLGVTEHTGIEAWLRATVLAGVAANRTTDLALDAQIANHRETGRREGLETTLAMLLNRLGFNKQLPPGFGPFDIRVESSYITTRT